MILDSQRIRSILACVLKVMVVGLGFILGLWLIFSSNMGPSFFPDIWEGALDFWIRMGLLFGGIGMMVVSIAYLFWPLGRRLWQSPWLDTKPDDNRGDIVLKITIRLMVAIIITILGFFLVFGATIGPAITDAVGGGLDWAIRFSAMVVGAVWAVFAIFWLLWPVGRILWRSLVEA